MAAYDAVKDLDVIHDHTVFGPLYARQYAHPAIVTTNHGPFTEDARALYARIGETAAVVAISHHQRAQAPEVPVARVIHHGIHLSDFPAGTGDGGYLLFLGRMAPEKGVHRAIRVAQRSGIPLLIAAKMREQDECDYFHELVEPQLGRSIQYVGEANKEERKELLRSARALIDPIRWPEPFGLVMIEAMACGTPVIVFPEGAAPEIVEHGITGFICADEDNMLDAVTHIDDIERSACRAAVETRFSAERMTRDHIDLYTDLLESGVPAP
ncbi:MAG: glycosyltransferase family 4 protein, partial [Acidimicrobiia bacterium]|nr:glycosyltransferase family 4 protein [Acidimicrobiia bacterium]MDX2468528.1 glycosyltransferase family 4 protein [Acidimicrobiia bacterium]